ncbi:hypothetical protein OAL43_02020 [bacterium]|nr:hypothetical protein [bacterium]
MKTGHYLTRTLSVAVLALILVPAITTSSLRADDHFLTIGGGYLPSGNQASLERNVLYFQRILEDRYEEEIPHTIFFADGNQPGKDLQVMDRDSVPEPNRLMAEFFGSRQNLGVSYRDHQVPGVKESTRPEKLKEWFKENGKKLQSGDRLFIYVTSHGNGSSDREKPHNTTIATWGRSSLSVKEMCESLDKINKDVEVVVVMVQCHAGGFAHLIFNNGNPEDGLSPQRRIGFFATVHDRAAAGCTPDIHEENYAEYSSYFLAALSGTDRLGQSVESADYNEDGQVSFDEAHAYVMLTADTIDFPLKTSDAYLDQYSKFGEGESELLANDIAFDEVLALANDTERCVLEGLSKQLDLDGNDRLVDAYDVLHPKKDKDKDKRRGRQPPPERERLRIKIREDVRRRWPELANVLNPLPIELLTSRSQEFVEAITKHKDYERYCELKAEAASSLNDAEKKVKFDRFLRVADHIILRENLLRMADIERVNELNAIVDAEQSFL